MNTVAVYCRLAMVFFDWDFALELPTDVSELPDLEIDWQLRDGDDRFASEDGACPSPNVLLNHNGM